MLLGLVNMAAVHPECAVRWEKPHLGQAGSYADATLENRIGGICILFPICPQCFPICHL